MGIVVAWVLLIAGEVTGASRHLDHDAMFQGGVPPWLAVCLFLAGWVVMIVAMMVPVMLPALGRSPTGPGSPRTFFGAFLGGFVFVWLAAGSAALSLDLVLHRAVHRVSALEGRPWVVAALLLAAAATVQLAPSTRRHLAGCQRVSAPRWGGARSAFVGGREHGARCLRADGPLMLVMFAAGTRLGWMALLTAVMAAERSSRAGRHVAAAAGVALLVGAALIALNPVWLPAPFGTIP